MFIPPQHSRSTRRAIVVMMMIVIGTVTHDGDADVIESNVVIIIIIIFLNQYPRWHDVQHSYWNDAVVVVFFCHFWRVHFV